jgi:plasmid replication initiation protein
MFAPGEDGSAPRRRASGPEPLHLFRALPGDLAPRDAQDLMAYPFFSLAKSKRLAPIDFRAGAITSRVEAVPEHGMATIWDADVLIWAASQIVNARDAGLRTSRLMAATPYEILTFVGWGASARDYQRLKAGLDRLQWTTVATSIRQMADRRRHRFSWINEWKERADANGRALGVELILPDWFYAGVLEEALVLTIDRSYFSLTGGLERWLYRVVRKHGGRQEYGWSFDFAYLHAKSGSLSPLKHFSYDLRDIVRRSRFQATRLRSGARLRAKSASPSSHRQPTFRPKARATANASLALWTTCEFPRAIRDRAPRAIGDRILVPSGTKIL